MYWYSVCVLRYKPRRFPATCCAWKMGGGGKVKQAALPLPALLAQIDGSRDEGTKQKQRERNMENDTPEAGRKKIRRKTNAVAKCCSCKSLFNPSYMQTSAYFLFDTQLASLLKHQQAHSSSSPFFPPLELARSSERPARIASRSLRMPSSTATRPPSRMRSSTTFMPSRALGWLR